MITTGRTAFRYAVEKALTGGVGGFTRECRLAEAEFARRCRNIWFNAIPPVILQGAADPLSVRIQARTQPFGMPIIVTDILNFRGNLLNFTYWREPNALVRLFTTEDASVNDFFGTGGLVDVVQTFSHDRNRFSPTVFDGPSNKIHFCPYLLKPGQIFNVHWLTGRGVTLDIDHELDFRGVVVLPETDPYGQLCGALRDQVCGHIGSSDPETSILDITIPAGTDLTEPREFITEPQARPMLIYGIGSNMNAAFCQLRDPSTNWTFTAPAPAPVRAVNAAGLSVPFTPPPAQNQGLPIYVVASNSEITNRDAYHWLAVPHLLQPNTSLIFRLAGGFDTIDLFANEDQGIGRISLIGRTV